MEINGLPVYRVVINDDDNTGVEKMSIVDNPAAKKHFLKFSDQTSDNFKKPAYSVDEEKRIIRGVALRANYPIYRNQDGREFYLVFEPETIERIVCKFMLRQNIHNVNTDHKDDVSDVFMIESFILSDFHSLNSELFDDVEHGSWIVGYKVNNAQVWDRVKGYELNGFSPELEAYIARLSEEKQEENLIPEIILYNLIFN